MDNGKKVLNLNFLINSLLRMREGMQADGKRLNRMGGEDNFG